MKPTTSYTIDTNCAYCNEVCSPETLVQQSELTFCCFGCATLYDVHKNIEHYQWSDDNVSIEFKQYDLPEVFNQLVDFQNDNLYKVTIAAPSIYCSSCVELLEDLPGIKDHIFRSSVNFESRTLTLTVDKSLPLSHVAMLLDKLGYPPQLNVSKKAAQKQEQNQKDLLRKVAVAGFCFGNSMMFSMPHYFGLSIAGDAFFVSLFRYLNVALSVLVLAYPARDYFKTAFQSLAHKKSHIDIPIVLGIIAIWAWSIYEIFAGIGFGYLDSLAGLIFFLLVGKWYQHKIYRKITFDRSLHDFLPLSVRTKSVEGNTWTHVNDLKTGDIVVVKNNEVIPVNGQLISGKAIIDYSFVTGESKPELIRENGKIFIGGKQTGGQIEILITEPQDTTKIWSTWKTAKTDQVNKTHWTTTVSMYFTPIVLLIAVASLAFWLYFDSSKALFVFSSVLIVACPCALALSTPFTYGSILRVLSKNKLYLKQAESVEILGNTNHIIFDKTGTLTSKQQIETQYHGVLTDEQKSWVKTICGTSNHPYSVAISQYFESYSNAEISAFEAIAGKGLHAVVNGRTVCIGSATFVGNAATSESSEVYVSIDGQIMAHFTFGPSYRSGIKSLFERLGNSFKLSVLSGDNEGERKTLEKLYPAFQRMGFNNSPEDKKAFIETCHLKGDHTLMIGDGLNDQIALHQSDMGIAVTENVNGFYPSSDGILLADQLTQLPQILSLTRYARLVLKVSLAFSVFYNLIGITFAVAGSLTPIVAAILMPLSSITVVGLVTALVSFKAKRLELL